MIVRLEKRYGAAGGAGSRLLAPLFSLALAFCVGAVIFLLLGVDPLRAYGVMLKGTFLSWYSLSEVVVRSVPLMFTGLAVALAATMLLWNIGCEGQLVWGGICAAAVALFASPHLPQGLVLPCMVLAGAAGGALWGLTPALLKARLGVSEILTTLLLNYVAIIYMEHLYFGPWRDPQGYGFPGTAQFEPVARLPHVFGTRIHLGFFLALALAMLTALVLKRTKWGYRVRVTGHNPRAAAYAGMSINRETVLVMLASGALAGLAGMGEVSGIHFRLQQGLAVGYGYDGIIVAWLARLNPLAIPLVSLFLGGIIVGGEHLQSVLHLPASISLVLEATLLFGLLTGDLLTGHRLVIRRGAPVAPPRATEEVQ